MKFALDCEFIDTPTASECISLALVAADGRELYVEFEYPEAEITPWLAKHVVLMLGSDKVSFKQAAAMIREFVGGSRFDQPEFWAYYAAYDWYWFSRVFGGFMEFPDFYPMLCRDLANFQQGLPNIAGPEHFALNDARSLMHAMKLRGFASDAAGKS
jgi:3' exoribonuclease, RNase T-like